jgi:glycosyltransferase involved in cell wall biosynthesis
MRAYNVAEYIGPAIQSALAQTFGDFELIIMDDGSTDGTMGIANRTSDLRLRVVRSLHRGAGVQLRDGIGLTGAPYIAILDADDLWSPDKLERHVQFMDAHPAADLTFSWSRIVDQDGLDTGLTSRLWDGPISFSELLADNVIGNGSAVVLRRQALMAAGGVDPRFLVCHDLDVWLRIAWLRPGNVWAIPEFLGLYRRRPGQLTSDVRRLEREFDFLIEKTRRYAPLFVARVERQARANMQRFFAYGWYQTGHYGLSVRTMARSLRRAPKAFAADRRNWKMSAAALSGLLLPDSLHGFVTRAALKVTRA